MCYEQHKSQWTHWITVNMWCGWAAAIREVLLGVASHHLQLSIHSMTTPPRSCCCLSICTTVRCCCRVWVRSSTADAAAAPLQLRAAAPHLPPVLYHCWRWGASYQPTFSTERRCRKVHFHNRHHCSWPHSAETGEPPQTLHLCQAAHRMNNCVRRQLHQRPAHSNSRLLLLSWFMELWKRAAMRLNKGSDNKDLLHLRIAATSSQLCWRSSTSSSRHNKILLALTWIGVAGQNVRSHSASTTTQRSCDATAVRIGAANSALNLADSGLQKRSFPTGLANDNEHSFPLATWKIGIVSKSMFWRRSLYQWTQMVHMCCKGNHVLATWHNASSSKKQDSRPATLET